MSSFSLAVTGADAVMVADEVQRRVDAALAGRDAVEVLTSVTVPDSRSEEDGTLREILNALSTPSLFSPERVVVVRSAQNLRKHEVDPILAWLADPMDGVTLIVGSVGKKDSLAKACAEVVSVGGGDVIDIVEAALRHADLTFNVDVPRLVAEQFGDDASRVDQLARTLVATYGPGHRLRVDEVEPYLGDLGAVATWHLTAAIEKGNVADALKVMHRLLDSRERRGLQLVATLQHHYLRLCHALSKSEGGWYGADQFKGYSPKRMEVTERIARGLGQQRLATAVHWIAEADLAMKGGVSYGGRDLDSDEDPTERTVLEVLIARLARLGRAGRN